MHWCCSVWQHYKSIKATPITAWVRCGASSSAPPASTRTRQPLSDLQRHDQIKQLRCLAHAATRDASVRTYVRTVGVCARGGLARSLARAQCNFWCGARASERASTPDGEKRFSCTGVSLLRPPHIPSKALHNVLEARTVWTRKTRHKPPRRHHT